MISPQRRVADFPRPPAIERETRRITVVLGGVTIADTTQAWRILETTHPPTYYLPRVHFTPGSLAPGTPRGSFCEWKGRAAYVTLLGGDRVEADAGWTYAAPTPAYAPLRDHIALYGACCKIAYRNMIHELRLRSMLTNRRRARLDYRSATRQGVQWRITSANRSDDSRCFCRPT
jgi:uncharacterized protein (DUF427 family)